MLVIWVELLMGRIETKTMIYAAANTTRTAMNRQREHYGNYRKIFSIGWEAKTNTRKLLRLTLSPHKNDEQI